MQTIKPKTRLRGTVGDYFGVTTREYAALARFSSQAEAIGIKTLSIGKGPFRAGCRLQLAGAHGVNYELDVTGNGGLVLGKVGPGKRRVRLCEGGTNTEAQWERLVQALKNSEGRLS